MESKPDITVHVCYLNPPREFLRTLRLPAGVTLLEAIELSGLLQDCPELDLLQSKVGIYSVPKTHDTVLREHDRVEVYRPLVIDPMLARRRRAERSK